MINLGSWMNKVLTGWGVDEKIANTFDAERARQNSVLGLLPGLYHPRLSGKPRAAGFQL